jgi:hypothetical protein
MRYIAILTITLAVFGAATVNAQERSGGVGQAVGDIISDALGGKDTKRIQGHVVSATGSELIVRGGDGRTYRVDASSLPAAEWRHLQPGDAVTVAGKRGAADLFVAERIQRDAPSASVPSGTQSGYQRVHGYVESVGVSSLTLKTDSGETLAVDTSRLSPQQTASTRPGDVVSITGQRAGASFRAEVLRKD